MTKILDFGGPSKEAVKAAFLQIIAGQAVKIYVLPVAEESHLTFRELEGTLEDALMSLAEGHIGSIQIEGKKPMSLLAGIYRPKFASSSLRDWSASAEGLSFDSESAFEELRAIDGLTYIALSNEESPDFDADHITVRTFPWSDWRLLSGAARDENGKWVVRNSVHT